MRKLKRHTNLILYLILRETKIIEKILFGIFITSKLLLSLIYYIKKKKEDKNFINFSLLL